MKRVVLLLLVVLYAFNMTIVASPVEKLQGTWLENIIDDSFLQANFSYLTANNYEALDANKAITEFEFTLSLSTILKKYNIYSAVTYEKTPITRVKMASVIKTAFDEVSEIPAVKLNSIGRFKDMSRLNSNEILAVTELYERGIISGTGSATFNPLDELTQIQAISVIKRIDIFLAKIFVKSTADAIPYTIVSSEKKYTLIETGSVVERDAAGNMYITWTIEMPTGKGLLGVKNLTYKNGKIQLTPVFPSVNEGATALSVLSFYRIKIKINRNIVDKFNIPENVSVEIKLL